MWTYNSEKNLPNVLQRIAEVIPPQYINRKIITDDNSTDRTREIAKNYDWEVHLNKGKGVNDNTKTALSLVTSPYFCSFEHDIILNPDWWQKISKHLEDPTVAVAQGVRVSTNRAFRLIDNYSNQRGDFGHESLDNNIANTEAIRKFGYNEVGTPPALQAAGLKWVLDRTVVSDHIRGSLWDNIMHDYKMQIYFPTPHLRWQNLRLLLTSPVRAIHMAYKTRYPLMLVVYPLDRLAIFVGTIRKSKNKRIN
jgi:glycosyltransferase involved in cell wall biosynthesis